MEPLTGDQLLAELKARCWRLDFNGKRGGWRCEWWCVPCGHWKFVEPSGAGYDDPAEAIRAALRQPMPQ